MDDDKRSATSRTFGSAVLAEGEFVYVYGFAETPGKPWKYYVDMTRQLWDEARHAMMGEVGFVQAGIDWPQFVRVNST